jgi:hypothetical protein
MAYVSRARLVRLNDTFLYLHSTCGPDCLRVTCCHRGLINSNSKKTMRVRSRTQDPEQGIDHLHHYAGCLVVLTCLWSSICSLCGQIDLYIGYIPCKWKQICAHWTCSGGDDNGGSPMCYGGLGVLLKDRRRVFPVERGGIGIRVHRVP